MILFVNQVINSFNQDILVFVKLIYWFFNTLYFHTGAILNIRCEKQFIHLCVNFLITTQLCAGSLKTVHHQRISSLGKASIQVPDARKRQSYIS